MAYGAGGLHGGTRRYTGVHRYGGGHRGSAGYPGVQQGTHEGPPEGIGRGSGDQHAGSFMRSVAVVQVGMPGHPRGRMVPG